MPQSRVKMVWNLIMILLLMYTATYVPYKTAFLDDTSQGLFVFDIFVDTLFFLDIFVNFFSGYEVGDHVETRKGKIAKKYLKSWFTLDLLACLPF